jgi:hypothetical protein
MEPFLEKDSGDRVEFGAHVVLGPAASLEVDEVEEDPGRILKVRDGNVLNLFGPRSEAIGVFVWVELCFVE